MAKGRMVNITVATDKRLNSLSLEAHLVFLMAIPHLDRDGLLAGDAELLAGKVLPRRPELHPRLDAIVDEWCNTGGLVLAYDTPDTRVLYFPGFAKNNTIKYDREGASQFAPPPGYIRTATGLMPDASASDSSASPDLLPTYSGVTPDEIPLKLKLNLKEEKVMEKPPAAAKPFAAQFQAFANRIHMISSPYQAAEMAERLTALQEHNALDWWDLALKVAEDNNARKWAYVRAVLDKCLAAGTPPGAPKPGGNNNGNHATHSSSPFKRTAADEEYARNNTPEAIAAMLAEGPSF